MKTKIPEGTTDYGGKQIKIEKLGPGQLADTGGEQINRLRNQYAKEPPASENDFMQAFMGSMPGMGMRR